MKSKLNFKKYNKTYKVYGLALKKDKQDIQRDTGEVKNEHFKEIIKSCLELYFPLFKEHFFFYFQIVIENPENTEKNKEGNINPT